MNRIERGIRSVDAWQQRHKPTAFLFGVLKKFGDDRGSSLCALLAYYGFLALFPLLLLMVTGLGLVLAHNPHLRHDIVHSALGEFPIIGDQLGKNVHSLHASGFGLAIGLIGLVWGSLGFTQAAQHAMAEVWNVPGVHRPGFFPRLARGLSLIVVLGVGVLLTTALGSFATFGNHLPLVEVASLVGSFALNAALFVAAFRILTPKRIPTRDLLLGGVCAGVAWTALGVVGGYLLGHQLRHASQVYGLFAIVLGLLWWLYLGAQLTLYGAEVNVVRARQLYPRSIVQPPLTEPDRRTLRQIAEQEERRPEERVQVDFVDDASRDGRDDTATRTPS